MSLVLKINGKKFDFFNSTTLSLQYSALSSSFSFQAYFDDTNPAHRQLFKPLSFASVVIESPDTNETILTGTILNTAFKAEKNQILAQISGYSKTGVLGDCNIPNDLYPIEFNQLTLKQIADRLCAPFDITVTQANGTQAANELFEEIQAQKGQAVGQFLNSLATQKDLILTHDRHGNLVIDKPVERQITAEFTEETCLSIALQANGQSMHSGITVQKQSSIGTDNAGEAFVNNPFVSAYRPKVMTQSSGRDENTPEAARAALSTEIKNIKVTVELDRWTWVKQREGNKEEIAHPNHIVSVESPKVYLFNKTNFFVDKVSLKEDAKGIQTSTLELLLPEVYNSEAVSNIFK